MNIRRGLFRAWVGLTLMWACLIGVIFFAEAQKYFRPIRLTVANYQIEFPGTTSRSTVKEALVTFLKQEKLKGGRIERTFTERTGAGRDRNFAKIHI
jgi:hypothetical protein